jgi:hypothetical protein
MDKKSHYVKRHCIRFAISESTKKLCWHQVQSLQRLPHPHDSRGGHLSQNGQEPLQAPGAYAWNSDGHFSTSQVTTHLKEILYT